MTEPAETNFLDMPDDEIANMSTPPVAATEPMADPVIEEPAAVVEEDVVPAVEPASDTATVTAAGSVDEDEGTAPEVATTTPTTASAEPNYKEEYAKILAPFRANGKEIKVESVDDAVTLMKMGANYNKKMAALKPNLRLLKMLENNGLLDESKLSYLIDLDKKNPEAIGKLVKDSGLDPLSIDTTDESSYTPKTYTVDDNQLALDGVLEEIRETPSYQTTLNVIGNKWDVASRQIIVANPAIIQVLNDQVASGIYDQITAVVDRERMLGRLQGLSDLEAYRSVGDALHASGAFQSKPTAPEVIVPPKPTASAVTAPERDSRRRAASTTTGKPRANNAPTDFNPLAMSDDEFDKIASSKYR